MTITRGVLTVLAVVLAAGLAWAGQPAGKGRPEKAEKAKKLAAPAAFTCTLEGETLMLSWVAVEGAMGYRAVVQALEDGEEAEGRHTVRETAAVSLAVPLADLAAPGEPLPAQVRARVQGMTDLAAEAGTRPKATGRGKGRHTKWCEAPADDAGE